jgi:hypothetical protein
MLVPTTGLQVASHDAWLEEMRKEPSPEVGQWVGPEAEGRQRRSLASWLAGVAKRLRSRRWPEVPALPESPARAPGASV